MFPARGRNLKFLAQLSAFEKQLNKGLQSLRLLAFLGQSSLIRQVAGRLMSENREQDKETKVVDRRRVDEFGQDRDSQVEASGADFTLKDSSSASAVEPEINFMSFVVSLATQALMQMGQMSPPPGVDLKKDKTAARQTIEILAMLEAKTKGNLSKEESDMIEELLHNLRLSFLKM